MPVRVIPVPVPVAVRVVLVALQAVRMIMLIMAVLAHAVAHCAPRRWRRPRRLLAAGLGAGAAVFGAAPAIAPGWFARQFGIASSQDPTVATVVRSVGIRDAATGAALLHAALRAHDRHLHQWLLVRVACDTGDTVAVALALAAVSGPRHPRFLALGALALSAALTGLALLRPR